MYTWYIELYISLPIPNAFRRVLLIPHTYPHSWADEVTHDRRTNFPPIRDNQLGYTDMAEGLEEALNVAQYVSVDTCMCGCVCGCVCVRVGVCVGMCVGVWVCVYVYVCGCVCVGVGVGMCVGVWVINAISGYSRRLGY